MGRDLLYAWRWEDLPDSRQRTGGTLSYAGSRKFDHMSVRAGDILWIVNVEKDGKYSTGQLYLIGRLIVDRVLTTAQAIAERGASLVREKASQHVIAKPGTEMPYQHILLTDIAHQLRFVSDDSDRLTILSDGFVDGRQLQAIRVLTPESVALLRRRLEAFYRGVE